MLRGPKGDNKKIVRAITKAKNKNNEAKLKELFVPDFITYISGWPASMIHEQYIQNVQVSHKAFKSLIFIVEEMIAKEYPVRHLVKGNHIELYKHFLNAHYEISFYGILKQRIVKGNGVEEWQANGRLFIFEQMGSSVNHIT